MFTLKYKQDCKKEKVEILYHTIIHPATEPLPTLPQSPNLQNETQTPTQEDTLYINHRSNNEIRELFLA